MHDKKSILVKLQQLKTELRMRFSVGEIGLFGSVVRDDDTERSDIDILVEFEKPIGFFQFMELEEFLEEQLGGKVDLVSKKALKPYIGRHIIEEVVTI